MGVVAVQVGCCLYFKKSTQQVKQYKFLIPLSLDACFHPLLSLSRPLLFSLWVDVSQYLFCSPSRLYPSREELRTNNCTIFNFPSLLSLSLRVVIERPFFCAISKVSQLTHFVLLYMKGEHFLFKCCTHRWRTYLSSSSQAKPEAAHGTGDNDDNNNVVHLRDFLAPLQKTWHVLP